MKNRKVHIDFQVKDGKIYVKNLKVTPSEFAKIADIISQVVSVKEQKENFTGSVSVIL